MSYNNNGNNQDNTINSKKRVVIQLRVSEELKNKFSAYCSSIGTTMSDELKRYIVKTLTSSSKD